MPKNVAQVTVSVPKKLNADQRREIARDLIEFIKTRTVQGHGKGSLPWPGKAKEYSKGYKKSPPVDLTDTGEMLESIKLIKQGVGEIKLGIPISDKNWGKAKGNILGTYGQKSPIPGKARRFLDLSRNEIKGIIKDIKK